MQHQIAEEIATRLLRRFAAPVGGEGHIAGSIRRRKPEPRDIELLLPLAVDERTGDDPVYRAIRRHCIIAEQDVSPLLNPDDRLTDERWFTPVKGLKPGFRYAQLACDPSTVWPQRKAGLEPIPAFKVDIFRYDRPGCGHGGNFGWIMVLRTGPYDFGRAVLSRWVHRRGEHDIPASRDGYLLDATGQPIPIHTEQALFDLVGMTWIEPWERRGVPDGSGRVNV